MRSRSDLPRMRRVRFERHASRVVFDPSAQAFVVSWAKCDRPDSERCAAGRDPLRWLPSVAAVAMLYDRGRVAPDQVVYAAQAIGRALEAGDRVMLDTEAARKAAGMVRDLADMCADSSSPAAAKDIGQAIRRLLDEIAAVRFMNLGLDFQYFSDAMNALHRSLDECYAVDGFTGWSARSMRRRLIYGMRRRDLSDLVYTLIALLLDTGSCPLLSLADRRTLRMQAIRASGLDGAFERSAVDRFLTCATDRMIDMKRDGLVHLGATLSPQQLTDSVSN